MLDKISINPNLLQFGSWKPYTYISHDSENRLIKNMKATYLEIYCNLFNIKYNHDIKTMQKVKDIIDNK